MQHNGIAFLPWFQEMNFGLDYFNVDIYGSQNTHIYCMPKGGFTHPIYACRKCMCFEDHTSKQSKPIQGSFYQTKVKNTNGLCFH